jgi:ABC-type transporter Mla subunit MlaD
MTNEEWERQVEFIVSHQAQFSADIQRLNELHEQADARLTRIEMIIVGLHQDTDTKLNALAEDTNAKFNALAEDTNAKFNALIDSQMRLVESQAKADERLDALADSHTRLAESQAKSDERLTAFINVVERYISEGRNGATTNPGES